jgi:hypothetical protein
MRSMRPDRFVLDLPTAAWRGAQITSIVGGTTTVKMLAEANIIRTLTCATSLIPAGAQSVGCPIACRVTGGGADSYVIAEVIGSSFGPDAPTNNAASVAAGRFSPGIIPRDLTQEPLTWWEASTGFGF